MGRITDQRTFRRQGPGFYRQARGALHGGGACAGRGGLLACAAFPMNEGIPALKKIAFLLLANLTLVATAAPPAAANPYDRQIAEHIALLNAPSPHVRQRSVEALGFLRAQSAEAALRARLGDASAEVRRQAALALGWCGGRTAVSPLLAQLDDPDWLTRQAAHVALENLTGMEFPFNALAPDGERQGQAQTWRAWWRQAPADRPPADVLALLAAPPPSSQGWHMTVSCAYRGPP